MQCHAGAFAGPNGGKIMTDLKTNEQQLLSDKVVNAILTDLAALDPDHDRVAGLPDDQGWKLAQAMTMKGVAA